MNNEIEDLLTEATHSGITLWSNNGNLYFRINKTGALTNELRAKLENHKNDLIKTLSGPTFTPAGYPRTGSFLAYHGGIWDKICTGEFDVLFTNATHWIADAEGPFSLSAFEQAAKNLAAKHVILGSRVDDTSGEPNFVFEQPVALEFESLSNAIKNKSASDISKLASETIWRPFNARNETLFRPFVIEISATRHLIGFVLNHLIGDLSSVRILTMELLHQYDRIIRNLPCQTSLPTLQYADYICGMNSWIQSLALAHRLKYWKRYLSNAPACKLRPDRVVDPDEVCEIATQEFSLDPRQNDRLLDAARHLGTTLFFILVAIQARALSALTGQSDIVMLSMHHGRDDANIATLIGSTQNQLFLRIHVSEASAFATLVESVQRNYASAIANQISSGYIRDVLREICAQDCFPELNNLVTNSPIFTRSSGLEPQTAAGNKILCLKQFVLIQKPRSISKAKHFPGHKLTLWADQSGINGRISYLSAEYDDYTISQLHNTFMRVIDDIQI